MKTLELAPEFCPTTRHKIWAWQRSQPAHASKSDNALLRELGWSKNTLARWRTQYGESYREWFDREFLKNTELARDVLKRVGMMRAMNDFRYWKIFAELTGVISPRKSKRKIADRPVSSALTEIPAVLPGNLCAGCLAREKNRLLAGA